MKVMTKAQALHEAMIDEGYRFLVNPENSAHRRSNWLQLAYLIRTRDPEVTNYLESARMRRVGL